MYPGKMHVLYNILLYFICFIRLAYVESFFDVFLHTNPPNN